MLCKRWVVAVQPLAEIVRDADDLIPILFRIFFLILHAESADVDLHGDLSRNPKLVLRSGSLSKIPFSSDNEEFYQRTDRLFGSLRTISLIKRSIDG